MPPHSHHRAPHHTPQPVVTKPHPAAAHHHKAPAHAATKQHYPGLGAGRLHRATVIAVGNPATVQLHGSDATASWQLALDVNVANLTVGAAVLGVVFDPANPSDGLLTAVY